MGDDQYAHEERYLLFRKMIRSRIIGDVNGVTHV